MEKKVLTSEEKATIEKLYKEGLNVTKISEKVGRQSNVVSYYLNSVGIRPINHNRYYKTKRVCPNCRATEHQKNARFCFRCGADIRSEEIILCERVRKLLQGVQFLPENMRDEACDTLQAAMKYFEEHSA